MEKLKAKVRRSLDGRPSGRPHTPDGTRGERSVNKPLPSPPEQHPAGPRPIVHSLNAFAQPDESAEGHRLVPGPAKWGSEPPDQFERSQVALNRLNINDSEDVENGENDFYDARDVQDGPQTHTDGKRSQRSSKRYSTPMPNPHAINLNDSQDLSRKLRHEPAAISTMIPDSSSSKKDSNLPPVSPENLNHPPSPEAAVKRKSLPEHVRLPPGFQVADSVDSTVEENVAPAVTHEVRHRHTEEVIHEVITRDIHVDHHHTIVQPIRQVVVKPAVHYAFNQHGEKVEIPPPEGWQAPESFEPTGEEPDGVVAKRIMKELDATHKEPWFMTPPSGIQHQRTSVQDDEGRSTRQRQG